VPCEPLLLSPPLPRRMAPCLRIGSYVPFTRPPSNITDKSPCWASPPIDVQWCRSPSAMAVTNCHEILGRLQDLAPSELTQPTKLFSWSVMIHGPGGVPRYHAPALP